MLSKAATLIKPFQIPLIRASAFSSFWRKKPPKTHIKEPPKAPTMPTEPKPQEPPIDDTPKITLSIDGKSISVPQGTLLLDAIRKSGSVVPTLCYHPDLKNSGGICRICLVEDVKKPGNPIISCKTIAQNGMSIKTSDPMLTQHRQTNTSLLFNYHPIQCFTCPSAQKCEGRTLCATQNLFASPMKEVRFSLV